METYPVPVIFFSCYLEFLLMDKVFKPLSESYRLRFVKNGVFWDVAVRRLLPTASIVPSSPILVTLMKEALSSFETSDLTRATRRNIPEDAILHSHSRENLKSYIALTGWTL
jgi:hypothetical protein